MSLVVVIGYTFSVVLFKNRSNPFLHEPKPWVCFAFPLQTVLLCKGGLFRSQLPSLLQQQTRGAAAHCNLDCTFSARLTTYCLLFLWLRSSFPPRHATCLFISPQQGRGLCLRKRCRQQDKRLLGNKKTRMMNFFWSPHTFSLERESKAFVSTCQSKYVHSLTFYFNIFWFVWFTSCPSKTNAFRATPARPTLSNLPS